MKPSRAWMLAGAAGLVLTTAAGLAGSRGVADASTLSRSGAGWLAARRYLEERGSRVSLLDRAPEETATSGLLVLAFPWQVGPGPGLEEAVSRHLSGGRDLLFAYGGSGPFDVGEHEVAHALGLESVEPRPRAPLNPLRFRAWAAEEWTLSADASLPGVRPVRVAAPRQVPVPPGGARILLRAQVGSRAVPMAFEFRQGRARVMVVPADALSNGRLTQPGNADLLEALRQELGDTWTFDEFHHGLQAKLATTGGGPEGVFTLLVLQLLFVYLMLVLALVRRFGPAWTDPPVVVGSAAAYLVGLGAVHHRLRHHREAGELLVQRARELDGRLTLPEAAAEGGASLLALAQRVGRVQSGRPA